MSSSIGVTESSLGNGPPQVSPPAFEGDKNPQGGDNKSSAVGGKVKISGILGSIAGIAGPTAALAPLTAPIALPIAAIAGIGSAIARLFGGGVTQKELDMIMHIKGRVDQRRDLRGVTGSPAN